VKGKGVLKVKTVFEISGIANRITNGLHAIASLVTNKLLTVATFIMNKPCFVVRLITDKLYAKVFGQ
jgi:hypothetical protein